MSDLRAQVVEAMAQAMYEADYPLPRRVAWEDLASYVWVKYQRKAKGALDAALDVLEEQIPRSGPEGWRLSRGLLAVLRAGKGSDE